MVISSINSLSSLNSPPLSSNMVGVSYKQFKRSYPGNYSFNFAHGLSATNDISTKNYSNFYLSNSYKISDILSFDNTPLKSSGICGSLLYGGDYLKFNNIDYTPYGLNDRYREYLNYGVASFTNIPSEYTKFTFEIFDDNNCRIYYTLDFKKFYLCADIDNNLVFIKESLINNNTEAINPQDFTYLFSESSNNLFIFKKTSNGVYIMNKSGNSLQLQEIVENDVLSYITTPFTLSRNIYTYPNINLNSSFVTYSSDNTVNDVKSFLNLQNNYLFHSKYSVSDSNTDVIILKNQSIQDDIISLGNNLLSSIDGTQSCIPMREYSTIGNDIIGETTESLELNYVFYNKGYKISQGSNEFISPSSINPFTQININDTTFIKSGAFAYPTPAYADKVYHLSDDGNNYSDDQHLLCAWLSGSPLTTNKIWVDRYYYPDLISKADALSYTDIFNDTYENYIESLIQNNTDLRDSVIERKIFDKLSDLVFVPNQKYRYDRLNMDILPSLSSTFTPCNALSSTPTNYFKQINETGELTIGFNFEGDNSSWIVKSDRNLIDSGITIDKSGSSLTITCRFYDATTYEYDESPDSLLTYSINANIEDFKRNFITISVNTKIGNGYVMLNNVIILTFSMPQYQIYIKRLLYGDFFMYIDGDKHNLLYDNIPNITNVFVNDFYVTPESSFVASILGGEEIDDLYITLPCGMRNSSDEIEYLNSVCSASVFKSNNINIKIKNVDITNSTILGGLSSSIVNNLTQTLPPNININKIDFENFR